MEPDTQAPRAQPLEAGALLLAAMSFYTAMRVRGVDRGDENVLCEPPGAAAGANHSGGRGDGGRTRTR